MKTCQWEALSREAEWAHAPHQHKDPLSDQWCMKLRPGSYNRHIHSMKCFKSRLHLASRSSRSWAWACGVVNSISCPYCCGVFQSLGHRSIASHKTMDIVIQTLCNPWQTLCRYKGNVSHTDHVIVHFNPRPVLAFGYCRCLRLSVCVSVRVCDKHLLVRATTHHPFKLGSPNLDHRCKRPWLRYLLFLGVIDLDLQCQI